MFNRSIGIPMVSLVSLKPGTTWVLIVFVRHSQPRWSSCLEWQYSWAVVSSCREAENPSAIVYQNWLCWCVKNKVQWQSMIVISSDISLWDMGYLIRRALHLLSAKCSFRFTYIPFITIECRMNLLTCWRLGFLRSSNERRSRDLNFITRVPL
jgi:hypothetical protein